MSFKGTNSVTANVFGLKVVFNQNDQSGIWTHNQKADYVLNVLTGRKREQQRCERILGLQWALNNTSLRAEQVPAINKALSLIQTRSTGYQPRDTKISYSDNWYIIIAILTWLKKWKTAYAALTTIELQLADRRHPLIYIPKSVLCQILDHINSVSHSDPTKADKDEFVRKIIGFKDTNHTNHCMHHDDVLRKLLQGDLYRITSIIPRIQSADTLEWLNELYFPFSYPMWLTTTLSTDTPTSNDGPILRWAKERRVQGGVSIHGSVTASILHNAHTPVSVLQNTLNSWVDASRHPHQHSHHQQLYRARSSMSDLCRSELMVDPRWKHPAVIQQLAQLILNWTRLFCQLPDYHLSTDTPRGFGLVENSRVLMPLSSAIACIELETHTIRKLYDVLYPQMMTDLQWLEANKNEENAKRGVNVAIQNSQLWYDSYYSRYPYIWLAIMRALASQHRALQDDSLLKDIWNVSFENLPFPNNVLHKVELYKSSAFSKTGRARMDDFINREDGNDSVVRDLVSSLSLMRTVNAVIAEEAAKDTTRIGFEDCLVVDSGTIIPPTHQPELFARAGELKL